MGTLVATTLWQDRVPYKPKFACRCHLPSLMFSINRRPVADVAKAACLAFRSECHYL